MIVDEYTPEPDEGPPQSDVVAFRMGVVPQTPTQEESAGLTCDCEVAWCEHQTYRMT